MVVYCLANVVEPGPSPLTKDHPFTRDEELNAMFYKKQRSTVAIFPGFVFLIQMRENSSDTRKRV